LCNAGQDATSCNVSASWFGGGASDAASTVDASFCGGGRDAVLHTVDANLLDGAQAPRVIIEDKDFTAIFDGIA
jgi:hypothetical protein